MHKHKGLIKDLRTGQLRATRSFREKYSAIFGRAGIDLAKPFENEKALLHAAIDTLDDATCDALAEALGLIPKEEKGGD